MQASVRGWLSRLKWAADKYKVRDFCPSSGGKQMPTFLMI
jgi:hypothetical protein